MKLKHIFLISAVISACFLFSGCVGMAASAEEYYSIGMAFFEMGRFEDAEKWLTRAKQADRTMSASEYNLGRIAFELNRFEEAAEHFENILKRDADNVLALRAAAYTRIKTGDIDIAEEHYAKLLALVPESIDDGYNHALVLFAMEHFDEAGLVLENYPFAIQDNSEVLLLYARIQRALNKVEAIDLYSAWLNENSGSKVRFEYAELLEQNELFARAIEEYRQAIKENTDGADEPAKNEIRFALARLLLIADSESGEGITEMETAVREGFNDIEAVEEVQKNEKVSLANRNSLRNIVNNMQRALEEAEAAAEAAAEAEAADEEEGTETQDGESDGTEDLSETNPENSTD